MVLHSIGNSPNIRLFAQNMYQKVCMFFRNDQYAFVTCTYLMNKTGCSDNNVICAHPTLIVLHNQMALTKISFSSHRIQDDRIKNWETAKYLLVFKSTVTLYCTLLQSSQRWKPKLQKAKTIPLG